MTLTKPIRFESFLRPMVWGGRRLNSVLNKELPTGDPYGESWEVSAHPNHESVLVNGSDAKHTLVEMFANHAADIVGDAGIQRFPWLIKFLDISERLSVQVHPDEEKVKELWPGENSKTEAWFVIAAEPDSVAYAGLKEGIGPDDLRLALSNGRVLECLHSFTPTPGDCIFLPSGTVHAASGGILIAEIQQSSDATFRLYDWDRPGADGKMRELHIEQSLACIHWDKGPVTPIHVADFPNSFIRRPLVGCPYFELEYVGFDGPEQIGGGGRMHAVVVLHGTGRLDAQQLSAGQVWLLPAAAPAVTCEPDRNLALMICTFPN